MKVLNEIINKLKSLGFVNDENIEDIDILKNPNDEYLLHISYNNESVIVIYEDEKNEFYVSLNGETIRNENYDYDDILVELLNYVIDKHGSKILYFENKCSYYKFVYENKVVEFFEYAYPMGSDDPDFEYREIIKHYYKLKNVI